MVREGKREVGNGGVEGVDDEGAVARWQDEDVIVEKVVMSSSPPERGEEMQRVE
jgi:hypothetical protein